MPKTLTSIYLDYDLKMKAKEYRLNISHLASQAIEDALNLKKDDKTILAEQQDRLIKLEKEREEVSDYLSQLQSKQKTI